MKKININKEEGIAEIIERLLAEEEEEVTLVIPKGSSLGRSVANFHLLKREVDAAGKSVVIESVDDNILAFAKESDLDASHPLWRGVRGAGGGVSDIIPASGSSAELGSEKAERPAKPSQAASKKKAEPTKLVVHAEEEEEEGKDEEAATAFEEDSDRFFKARSAPELGEPDEEEEAEQGGAHKRRVIWLIIGAAAVVIAALAIVTLAFGHAAVALTMEQTPWNDTLNFAADKTVSTSSPAQGVIPAQVFSADKNATQLFPASGSANVSIKARGTITIYNDYSSAPQDLVATTRFLTPDGKLFRLVAGITIPGATVKNGQITPSSITATVAADQPGSAYNVGPVQKLTIPGFQGSPKYNGFYGALLSGASGGATGVRPVPTAADIAAAKTKMQSILQSALTTDIASSYPNNFKILDGATQVTVGKLTVNTTTDANGNFSVFGEATLNAIGFDEGVLDDALLALAAENSPTSTWKSVSVSYSNVKADFTNGTVDFTVAATGTLEQAFDANAFKASIAGKSINGARAAVAAIPGLANGKISVWPMWLWSIPSDPAKVNVTVD